MNHFWQHFAVTSFNDNTAYAASYVRGELRGVGILDNL